MIVTPAIWREIEAQRHCMLAFHRSATSRLKSMMRPGDVVFCLMLDKRRWRGAYRVEGVDRTFNPVGEFPNRYRVAPIAVASVPHENSIIHLRHQLTIRAEPAVSRGPYAFAKRRDGEYILQQLRAQATQVSPQSSGRVEVPSDLIEACQSGECVAYVGAGLSAPAGMPTWGGFVIQLMEWAIQQQLFDSTYAESLRSAAEQGSFNDVADAVVSKIENPSLLAGYLKQTFGRANAKIPDTYKLIKETAFSAVLTTNFDNFLERTFGANSPVYTPEDAEALVATQSTRGAYILKLYGAYERATTIVANPAQYQAAVTSNITFSRYMQGLFVSRTILFVGASLEGISVYLDGLNFRGTTAQTRKHYALVAVQGTSWRPKADLLQRRYGIHVLPFTPGPRFEEVTDFLSRLRNGVTRQQGGGAPGAIAQVRPSRLDRIRLENIGPFELLEMEFDPEWNVIVGDNGVGKSAILKAISVAVLGEDSAPYAHRLIRQGAREAAITIETDTGKKYVTKIFSTDGVQAVVESHPSRLLEAEGWLVLGFPALRMVSWQKAKDTVIESPPRIQAQDVLPLVCGDPDVRLDALKQWLLNLDYQIATSSSETSRRQQSDFQRLVKRLLPNGSIELASVDRKNRQIMVETPDGTLPLEAISQGAISFIGWVGVVLQRLYDIYNANDSPADVKPLDQYGLVLIDEIDAHMHPAWQRTVVQDVRSACPNVQFIATTHSPLIVGNLKPEQIVALRRGAKPERPTESLEGYRADQILTLPIFGLTTSVSVDGEKTLGDYASLLAKSKRTGKEESKMAELAERIGMQWPEHAETADGRANLRRIEEAALATFKELPTGQQRDAIQSAMKALEEQGAS